MGVFDDKKFDDLDWISQATEPIQSKFNDILAAIPDTIDIDFDTYLDIMRYNHNNVAISTTSLMHYLLKKYTTYETLHYTEYSKLIPVFALKCEDVVINFEDRTITGSLKAIKLVQQFDDKALQEYLGMIGLNTLQHLYIQKEHNARTNEILDIIGKCEGVIKSRSSNQKKAQLYSRVNDILKNNEWRIRDDELANKICFWIRDYIQYGNVAALSNLCKLKVMTHKEQAIYSIEEAQ